jgi:LysM repeat protein
MVVAGLAIALGAAAVCILSLSLAGGALASSHGAARAGYRGMHQIVVEPGQSLWSIASAAEPAADPRIVIPQIIETNSLAGNTVYVGEMLWLPGH